MKKKTLLTCAAITILSFAPFLGGCASTGSADVVDTGTPAAQEVVVDNTGDEATATQDSTTAAEEAAKGETVIYARVVSVDGDEVTVEEGTLTANAGTGEQTFASDGVEQTFNTNTVTYVDAEGNELALNDAGEVGFAPGDIVQLVEYGDTWAVNPIYITQADLAYNAGM